VNQSTGREYCAVPTICLKPFGRCDSDDIPPGPPTSGDKRPEASLGPIIRCTEPGTVAITFDDGPSNNTETILNLLREAGAKATFFVTGNNNGKGEIDLNRQWREDIQAMDAEDHQIASHTWTHPDLDTLSSEERKIEMYRNERAIANILGRYPTYMRPPYISCGELCTYDMKDLGYQIINWSADSGDSTFPTDFEAMKRTVDKEVDKFGVEGGAIFVQHDTIPVSALQTTKYILDLIKKRNWKAVTVAECLGEQLTTAYRSKTPASISIDHQ
jgi:peptidoglycan/xylan/chitin deacetylase (PgdA/CDA1 family)